MKTQQTDAQLLLKERYSSWVNIKARQ